MSHHVPGCLRIRALSHGKNEEGKLQKYFLMIAMMLAKLLTGGETPSSEG